MSLEKIIIEPPQQATSCVIWLHGLGDSGAGFAPIVPALHLPANHTIRFIFPDAPQQAVTINQGAVMRSWYDIKSMALHSRADLKDVEKSESRLHALIQSQLDDGIASHKIVIAGFSQGGVMSLYTGLRYPLPLAGILAMSCYLANGDKLPAQCSIANKHIPILQHHGKQDEVVPFAAGKSAHQLLEDNGYSTQWQSYDMPHTLIEAQLSDISSWIQETLSKS